MTIPSYASRMTEKLSQAFRPTRLEIKDDSSRHAGHREHNPKGETHFIVTITSESFKGVNPVQRHRMVYNLLAAEMNERIHALSLTTLSPEEDIQP